MRILLLLTLLLPAQAWCQQALDTASILDGKAKFLVPKGLTPMTDQMWNAKYPGRTRPVLALSDEAGEVNLLADWTQQPAREEQMEAFKDFQIQQLKRRRPDFGLLADGVAMVHNRKVGWFKFASQAIDQGVFNYYFFTPVEGRVLLFSFNCIQSLQQQWTARADQIAASLVIYKKGR